MRVRGRCKGKGKGKRGEEGPTEKGEGVTTTTPASIQCSRPYVFLSAAVTKYQG